MDTPYRARTQKRNYGIRNRADQGRLDSRQRHSDERIALEYVHAFLLGKAVTDEQFNALIAAQGPRAITDLCLLIGYFRTLGWMLATYEVDLEPRELLDRY